MPPKAKECDRWLTYSLKRGELYAKVVFGNTAGYSLIRVIPLSDIPLSEFDCISTFHRSEQSYRIWSGFDRANDYPSTRISAGGIAWLCRPLLSNESRPDPGQRRRWRVTSRYYSTIARRLRILPVNLVFSKGHYDYTNVTQFRSV